MRRSSAMMMAVAMMAASIGPGVSGIGGSLGPSVRGSGGPLVPRPRSRRAVAVMGPGTPVRDYEAGLYSGFLAIAHGPAPTVRGHQDVRQAPGAVVDARGWPVATHVLAVEGAELVLYGPPVDLTSKRPCLLVIETFVDDPTAERGVWHRPMTPRELFALQDGDETFVVEGPRSSSKKQAGIIEWIGNMIPVRTATAIGLSAKACLLSGKSAGFLRGQDVWVSPETDRAPASEVTPC